MWAARHGHLSMVETLLANGLNLLQARWDQHRYHGDGSIPGTGRITSHENQLFWVAAFGYQGLDP